jgi:hypothetical protein
MFADNLSGRFAMGVSELDRWRAAQQLINRLGDDAELDASVRAEQFLAGGDAEGFQLWLDIARKVRQLQSETPQSGTVN